MPIPTGSCTPTNTTGSVLIVAFAATAPAVDATTTMSTFLDELAQQGGEAIDLAISPALHEDDASTLCVTALAQAALEGIEEVLIGRGSSRLEEADPPGLGRLLGAGGPGRGREPGRGGGDEPAPVHPLTTSSSRANSDGGTVSPVLLAIFRLMASSSLVGCSTGRSPGFAPLRILST
jgi:hypothetical protein